MIRATHNFPSIKTEFEWIVNPILTDRVYSVDRLPSYYNNSGTGTPEERFGFNPNDVYLPPYSISAGPPAYGMPGWSPSQIVGWPVASSFIQTPMGFWVPKEIPAVSVQYPVGPSDTRYGFRTRTEVPGSVFGLIYWHTQLYDPVVERGALLPTPGLPTREYDVVFPNYDLVGAYSDTQLTKIPGVLRTEAVYSWNQPYNTFNMGPGEDGVVRRDHVKYMIAYDLTGYLYFDWHKTSSFDITLEHIGDWVPDSSDLSGGLAPIKLPQYQAQFNANISTTWYYNLFTTSCVIGYSNWGSSLLLIPTVGWNPPFWNGRFSATLQYIGISGNNNYDGILMWHDRDVVLLTTQLNF